MLQTVKVLRATGSPVLPHVEPSSARERKSLPREGRVRGEETVGLVPAAPDPHIAVFRHCKTIWSLVINGLHEIKALKLSLI